MSIAEQTRLTELKERVRQLENKVEALEEMLLTPPIKLDDLHQPIGPKPDTLHLPRK